MPPLPLPHAGATVPKPWIAPPLAQSRSGDSTVSERPGAVYLAAVLAAHAQKGLPAFGIYGHDVQDLDDNTIPQDVAEKILRWARAAVAVAQMRGGSYLSIGSQCMGIAGSIVDQDFFQEYLGMRNESVDEVEILRRMDEGIYDQEEYAKAMAWVEKYCKVNEGWDKNRPEKQKDRNGKEADWEFVVKMTLIIRDLMLGNPRLQELGFKEEAIVIMPLQPASRVNANGPTGNRTAISAKHFCAAHSTGTVYVSPIYWPPKTTPATASPCSLANF